MISTLLTCLLTALPTAVETRLDVGDSSKVVRPGQEDRVAIELRNPGTQPVEGTLHSQVETFEGDVYPKSQDVALAASGRARVSMPKGTFDRLGIKWIEYHWQQDGRKIEPARAAFAYMKPTGPGARGADGFIFAIAYGAGPDNLADEAARRSSLCGVAVTRANPRWGNVQPKKDVWNWEIPDQIMASRAKHGMEVQWLIHASPRWCRVDPEIHTPRTEPWREFCTALARRYADRVELYEIWNEPDISFFNGTIEDYLGMLPVAYEAVKAGDPTSRVTTGGFTSLDHHGRKIGMTERVIEHCQESYDLIAYHKHGDFGGFVEEFEYRLTPLCSRVLKTPKPLYMTETGMDTRRGEHFQARTLPKKFVYAWANGAVGYTWFNLHDMPSAEHDRQPGFTYGLFTRLARFEGAQGWAPEVMDYENAWPKAAYVAYNTLAGELRDTAFVERIPLERDQYAYLFAGDDRQVIVAFNENPRRAAPHLVLRTKASTVETVDLMGNRQELPLVDGRALLTMTTEPTYWVFSGTTQPPTLEGPLAAPTGRLVAVPRKPLPLAVELWNPTAREITFHTKWSVDERLEVASDDAKAVRLAPGDRRQIALNVVPTSRGRIGYGAAMPCRLSYRCEPTGWTGELGVPVTMGAVTLPRGELSKHPLFRLSNVDQVVNLSEHDPHTAHLLWKGRDDLSADVFAARKQQGIELLINIRDNVHHAPKASDLGQSDHVELLLQMPDRDALGRVRIAAVDGAAPKMVTEGIKAKGGAPPPIRTATWGEPPWRHFRVTLPDEVLGLSDVTLAEGLRLNVRIHDNDGKGQKGWIELAPGETPDSSSGWPLLMSADKR